MRQTFYIVNRATGSIFNAVDTDGGQAKADEIAAGMTVDCYATANPPLVKLQAYRYWNERP